VALTFQFNLALELGDANLPSAPPGQVEPFRRQSIECGRWVDDLEARMSLGTILLILLILLLVGALPSWPHSRSWGYGPSGALGAVLVVILILVLIGGI
jgi:hypothetical protein